MGEMGPGESGGGCGEAVPGDVGEIQVFCGEHPHHAGSVDRVVSIAVIRACASTLRTKAKWMVPGGARSAT